MSDNLIDKLAHLKGISSEKVKQWIRDKAIANAMQELKSRDKTPFDVGEEKFEALVAEKEKDFISDLKEKGSLALAAAAAFFGLS